MSSLENMPQGEVHTPVGGLSNIQWISRETAKSHLLQSQIKVIEAVILAIGSEEHLNDDLTEWSEGYNHCIQDQISSLNETLEELKKSL